MRRLLPWTSISLTELSQAAGSEYLAFCSPSAGWQITIAPPEGHPSQLMRRVVADAIGEPDQWNWRVHPRRSLTQESWRLAQVAFA